MLKHSFYLAVSLFVGFGGMVCAQKPSPAPGGAPRAHDPRLQVELFAAAPDIVHPVALECDSKGRLLVIESHTHFRPANYQGPPHDRIRMFEDTNGDGKADRITTFFEGTRATMDIAAHPDRSIYVATRNEILRLRDTKGTGKADEKQRIIFLDTTGNYPHNGLSGLSFDFQGNLYFGMGENIGAPYKVVGSDGTTVSGEGDGGHIFWCTADGRKLRRVATGFWNPFGTCRDIYGRLFAVDNDPDAMPPCRLLHVPEGGDFGYQYRYGRTGRHPFQAWDGQLPGTLPMASGTGEAPCEVLSYESDGLPAEYRGNLLVTSWADHRIERYELKQFGARVVAERKPFVQGGKEFRPVGLAVAPDGSLFVSDWVKSDYQLHGKGAIWHIRRKGDRKQERSADPQTGLVSAHRPLREEAARRLLATEGGRKFLRTHLQHRDERVRATALTALAAANDSETLWGSLTDLDPKVPVRALAVRAMVERKLPTARFLDTREPLLVFEAIAGLTNKSDVPRLLKLVTDADPFIRHAATQRLAGSLELLEAASAQEKLDGRQRTALMLAWRASGNAKGSARINEFLADPEEDVRFLAAKWIADEKLESCRPLVVSALKDRNLSVRMYFALTTALARLDGQDVNETKMADHFVSRLTDRELATDIRSRMLQLVAASHAKLSVELLAGLLKEQKPALQLEAIRALVDHPNADRFRALRDAALNDSLEVNARAIAIVGLAERAADFRDDLFALIDHSSPLLRDEALRGLSGVPLTAGQQSRLRDLARHAPAVMPLIGRVLGEPMPTDRRPTAETAAWLKRLDGPADAAAGRRVFFHSKLAGCYRCHRAEGRGREIGPDLTSVGRNGRQRILESILQPSAEVAPHYQVWQIETADGKAYTGMLMRTYLDEYTYADAKGEMFKLNTTNIVESRTVPKSIMPDGLVNLMTDQELRDLLKYLESLR